MGSFVDIGYRWHERKKRGQVWHELWHGKAMLATVFPRGGRHWAFRISSGSTWPARDVADAKAQIHERVGIDQRSFK
jgi:hypothetical protein